MTAPAARPTIIHVAVVIPARDEAATITHALAAVADACTPLVDRITASCVVVADACTDNTADIARRWTSDSTRTGVSWSIIKCSGRRVGAARRLGTAAAIADADAHGVRSESMWLAHTDADTVVDPQWLTMQIELADHGIDAVAGIVELDTTVPAALQHRFAVHYPVNADGTHSHVHGANLAMRASTYLAAGGWADFMTGEDHDLWRRLNSVGACMSSTAITVRTSGRIDGRAPDGFAADIRSLMAPEVVA